MDRYAALINLILADLLLALVFASPPDHRSVWLAAGWLVNALLVLIVVIVGDHE